ncbi:hypothetical protein MVEN_01641900 [Mycena venus]|uniref:Uncharacterized protein n=1 Tax=Mycena venus TaxID=2733690 RepID=A0A8H6XN55_9AGAR|nr:hypothetical protein MVEN_01641900 [Mycena venus]
MFLCARPQHLPSIADCVSLALAPSPRPFASTRHMHCSSVPPLKLSCSLKPVYPKSQVRVCLPRGYILFSNLLQIKITGPSNIQASNLCHHKPALVSTSKTSKMYGIGTLLPGGDAGHIDLTFTHANRASVFEFRVSCCHVPCNGRIPYPYPLRTD